MTLKIKFSSNDAIDSLTADIALNSVMIDSALFSEVSYVKPFGDHSGVSLRS